MREHIYTIPVNEAFENSGDDCPFCTLYRKLEENELDLILGASMMEPDVRIETNKKGFCTYHFGKMLPRKNRLGIALMLQSHLEEVKKEVKQGGFFSRDHAAKPVKNISRLEESCYICDRIENNLSAMFQTAVYLYEEEKEFKKKFEKQKAFCLPHYKRLLEASKCINKDMKAELEKTAQSILFASMDSLYEDVSLFIKKFDYRFDDLPWGNSKDSIERAIALLTSEDYRIKSKK